MRRPRFRKSQTEVSLFPFLAVLICTMGGLIVLLVLVVQQAKVDADQVAERARSETVADAEVERLTQEYETQEWRRGVLEQQRGEKSEELAERRLELGHLEEHLRELQQRWRALARQLEEAKRQEGERDLLRMEDELRRLRQAGVQAEREVEEARRRAEATPRSYTIVPYRGPQGTRRRPIYLECTEQGVLIQPAGVLLPLADFQGPLGPGNPLDAALRAIREHWKRPSGGGGEPYPLLLVRPDGVAAYAAARAALKDWDDEFGYELVSGSMRLKYPPVDGALKPILEQTVRDARDRQRRMIAAMPSRFEGREGASGFVASRSGGFQPIGAARRPSSSGRGIGDGPGGDSAASRQGGTPPNANSGFYPAGTPEGGLAQGERPPTATSPTRGDARGTAEQRSSSEADPLAGRPPGATRPDSQANSDSQARGQAGSAAAAASGGVGGSAAAGHNQPGRPGNLSGGSVLGAMADSRGADWALPRSTPGATGVTRPLRVDCYADRLVIVPDASDKRPPKVVEFPGTTAGSIDAFVSAIWDEMEHWGIALAGGYWKPVLQFRVADGAEPRFAEVHALLRDSGLVVRRKQP